MYKRLNKLNKKYPLFSDEVIESGFINDRNRNFFIGSRDKEAEPEAGFLIGKVIESQKLSNKNDYGVWIDAYFPHVITIFGQRGSGKSWDLGIISEALSAKSNSEIAFGMENFATIIFDLRNQFWTFSLPSDELSEDQSNQLNLWGIPKEDFNQFDIYTPKGSLGTIEDDFKFTIKPSDLEPDDWVRILPNLEGGMYSAMGQCLIEAVKNQTGNFDIEDLINSTENNDDFNQNTKDAVNWRLKSLIDSNLFDKTSEDIVERLTSKGRRAVVQLGDLDEEKMALVIGVITRKIMLYASAENKLKKVNNNYESNIASRIWLIIDEAHVVCPKENKTMASRPIIEYAKRGRDAGLCLVVATQQPSAIDSDLISQHDISIIHRLSMQLDIDSAISRMPSMKPKMKKSNVGQSVETPFEISIRNCLPGTSIISDTETNRSFFLVSRPRIVEHGGGEPSLE